MKNLLSELCAAGLSEEEAKMSLQVVYDWVEEHYPVMASLARSTVERALEATEQRDQA
ncbi:MAG TPA: hypothetical protein VFR58_16455 [Flavisolibacter sp.]|nr:hypothetical protein [Flavisolibacter sp.]